MRDSYRLESVYSLLTISVLALSFAVPQTQADSAIPLEILEPLERAHPVQDFPVSVGMVFPSGVLTTPPGGALVDDKGRSVPFDYEVTGWWSEQKRDVKWLLLHFKASSDRKYSFLLDTEPAQAKGRPLAVESGQGIAVDTGPLRVRLAPGNAPVFESVSLNGRSMLESGASFFDMVDDEGRVLGCGDWTLTLEENTPLRAVIQAEGMVGLPGEPPLAKLSVRYQFFSGEGFVRLYHTFVWMRKSLDSGANRIGVRIRPAVGEEGVVRVGLSEFTDEAKQLGFGPDIDLVAYQDEAEHYVIQKNGGEVATGKHMGGWISVEGEDGYGVGVSLKNAWQTYPTALAVRKGDIEVGLWPEEAGRFSFEERDIMPDDLYFSPYWKGVAWTRRGGPTWFNTRDLLPEQARGFFETLIVQASALEDSPGKRIVSFLESGLQARLRGFTADAPMTDGFRARIAHGMNAFLEKPDFYETASWHNVDLKPRAKELLTKGISNLNRGELVWLNRLLIESAFPEAISPSDVPHFIHESSPFGKGGGYVPSGEGAARTHEMVLHFYDAASKRTLAQLNSLTQHPFIMRQSPEHAMRAPILGFTFSPVNRLKYPNIERALDMYGRASFSRYIQSHDYGFLRFGMQRMNYPGKGLYRWMAGMQYDQQIIPWLLFIRGGDRRYYEEAMNTATYAMDMHTNHYNTRGAPPGYMSFVAGMPLPEGATFSAYNMKIHFLSLCHHLTGYKRAGEVMDMAIEGTRQVYPTALTRRSKPVDRQLYGMNMFCVHAYEETFDPAMKELARASLERTLSTHYDPGINIFAGNTQYLYRGLLSLYRTFPEPEFREVMLKHLSGCGIPELRWAGLSDNRAGVMAVGCGWAYEQTGDERYARISWDVARTLADIAPDHDWSSPVPVDYPLGHFAAYCHRVLPMLLGLGVMERGNFDFPETSSIHDLFVAINRPGSTGTAFVRVLKDGHLDLRLKGTPLGDDAGISVAVFHSETGEKVAETTIETQSEAVFPGLRRRTFKRAFEGTLSIPNAKQGEIYRLSMKGDGQTTSLLVLCDDAQIVHKIAPESIQFFGHSYQYYLGTRIFARTRDDMLRVTRNPTNAGFTVRDAETHEVLARANILDSLTTEYRIGKGRMVELVLGAGRDTAWKLEGIEPYISATRDGWFAPDGSAGTGR